MSLIALAGVLGAASIASAVGTTAYNVSSNNWSKKMQREVFDYQKMQDERNFNYQKDLNNQIMQREDNAVQRRARDLEAAGISKHLAAGSSASSTALSTSSGASISNQGSQNVINNEVGTALTGMANMLADTKLKGAETQNIKSDTAVKKQEAINKAVEKGLIENQAGESLTRANLNEAIKEGQIIQNKRSQQDYEIDQKRGSKSNETTSSEYNDKKDIAGTILDKGKGFFTEDPEVARHRVENEPDIKGNEHINDLILRASRKRMKARDIASKYWDSIPGKNTNDKVRYIMDVINAYKMN